MLLVCRYDQRGYYQRESINSGAKLTGVARRDFIASFVETFALRASPQQLYILNFPLTLNDLCSSKTVWDQGMWALVAA